VSRDRNCDNTSRQRVRHLNVRSTPKRLMTLEAQRLHRKHFPTGKMSHLETQILRILAKMWRKQSTCRSVCLQSIKSRCQTNFVLPFTCTFTAPNSNWQIFRQKTDSRCTADTSDSFNAKLGLWGRREFNNVKSRLLHSPEF